MDIFPKKGLKFPIIIMLLIGLVVGLDYFNVFNITFKSPNYGWVINDQTNTYLTHEEKIGGWGYDNHTNTHLGEYQNKFTLTMDGRLKPLTKLNKEEMEIQKNQGCTSCHD